MATQAQIEANRANAQKSTGPRTPEGKAVVSRNAVTHGLLARAGVLPGEDEQEFQTHREGLLKQLQPGSPLEEVLAQRIVDLSWRLQRAARDQELAYAALYQKYLEGQPEPAEPEAGHAALGRMLVEDFCGPAILERLQRYERRIENSYYKALSELRQAVQQRRAAAPEEPLTAVPWEKQAGPAPQACQAKPVATAGAARSAAVPVSVPVPGRIGRMLRNNGAKQSQFRRESPRGIPELEALSLPLALQT